jgi:hypothetical protein
MKKIWPIVTLTLKSAFKFKVVTMMTVALLTIVVILPLIIKNDGTARGFIQIILTYSLFTTMALLGLANVWLSCGILAREIEECQLQLVVVKPIARWQIWLGKWIGIMLINAILLGIAGSGIYASTIVRAKSLPPDQQNILKNEVLVSRRAIKEPPPDISALVEQAYQEQLQKLGLQSQSDKALLRRHIEEQAKAEFQIVPGAYVRRWQINLGRNKDSLADKPIYIRTKFYSAVRSFEGSAFGPMAYNTLWQIGPPDSPKMWRTNMSLAAETFHEFQIPPNLFDDNGVLTIDFINPNDETLLFPLEDGMEVLCYEGGFTINFCRGLLILLFWLGLLSAIGLCASSFLSFPVAVFFSFALLFIGFSSGTMSEIVQEGGITNINQDTGTVTNPSIIDKLAVAVFGSLLKVLNLVKAFSPIDSLSAGRSISWTELAQALLNVVIIMGGFFAIVGISIFQKRELAAAQSSQ